MIKTLKNGLLQVSKKKLLKEAQNEKFIIQTFKRLKKINDIFNVSLVKTSKRFYYFYVYQEF